MAFRVDSTDVMELFADEAPDASEAQVTQAIKTSNLIINTRLVPALTPSMAPLSEDTLFEIEKYLAAHFVALIDTPRGRETVGGAIAESAQYQVDLGLLYTKYGQQAVMLDATGTLRAMTAIKAKPPTPVSTISARIYSLSSGRI